MSAILTQTGSGEIGLRGYRLAMNCEKTRNGSRTLGHWTHPTL